MTKYLIPIFLIFLCFIMPIQIYIMGDGYGAGVQGAFYRNQDSIYGPSFIPVTHEINFIISGIYGGTTALSVLVWLIADVLLVIATVISLIDKRDRTDNNLTIICSLLIGSGILFLVSVMLQYGIFLYGSAGISIPVGVPLIIISGWYFFKIDRDELND